MPIVKFVYFDAQVQNTQKLMLYQLKVKGIYYGWPCANFFDAHRTAFSHIIGDKSSKFKIRMQLLGLLLLLLKRIGWGWSRQNTGSLSWTLSLMPVSVKLSKREQWTFNFSGKGGADTAATGSWQHRLWGLQVCLNLVCVWISDINSFCICIETNCTILWKNVFL